MKKIVIGSPIHQEPDILKEFLQSLEELNTEDLQITYCFVDDNQNKDSIALLQAFKKKHERVYLLTNNYKEENQYICDDYTHRWTQDLVQKVTEFKNSIIEFAIEKEYDYLFFVDSDIVLHPKTIHQLIADDKEIVANVFWTQWNPNTEPLPQVWLKDAYTLYDAHANVSITQNEIGDKTRDFIEMIKKPGLYKVGGLGACTLISRSALVKGVNFNPVYNISFWGEDRHFCIRAAVLGIQLYADSYYPAYHIYRQADLAGVKAYKEQCIKRDTEILGSKILEKVIAGIEGVNTYSYKEDVTNSCAKHFVMSEFIRQVENVRKEKANLIRNKIINKCRVQECTMTFYNDNTMVLCKVKAAFEGFKQYYSYYEEYRFLCSLAIQENGEFLITELTRDEKLPLTSIPMVRKVRETPKLTLSMIVKDEEKRYLRKMLEKCREFIDNAVIIDDNSSDNTVALCKEVLGDIPLKIIQNDKGQFDNETNLRKQQWFETIATNPDWILFLDADEVFEDKFKDEIKEMLKDFNCDGYIFRLYDFWDENYFRSDKLWYAHLTYRPFLIRYQKNFKYKFTETAQHCGRMPENILELPYKKSELRLKHFGWAREEDRIAKYTRYMELDPEGKYGSMEQYISILDPTPNLVRWNEYERD